MNRITLKIDRMLQKGIKKLATAGNPEKDLEELHFELTLSCNCKCIMCDLWDKYRKEPALKEKELSLGEIKKFVCESKYLRNIKTVVLSGGEPFLRKDFVELCGFFTERYPGASIIILTNSYDTRLIEEKTNSLIKKYHPKSLCFGSSLDGIGEKHDQIRGVPGAFNRLKETIERVQANFKNIRYEFNFTITPQNYHELLPAYEFAVQHGCGFSAQFVVQKEVKAQFKWTGIQLEEIGKSISTVMERMLLKSNSNNGKGNVLRKMIKTENVGLLAQLYFWSKLVPYEKKPGRIFNRCLAGTRFAMFTPQGDLFFCPINKSMLVGNIRQYGFDTLWTSPRAEEIRKFINMGRCHCWLLCTAMPLIGEALTKEIPNAKQGLVVLKKITRKTMRIFYKSLHLGKHRSSFFKKDGKDN